jgi:hypothetical protein
MICEMDRLQHFDRGSSDLPSQSSGVCLICSCVSKSQLDQDILRFVLRIVRIVLTDPECMVLLGAAATQRSAARWGLLSERAGSPCQVPGVGP